VQGPPSAAASPNPQHQALQQQQQQQQGVKAAVTGSNPGSSPGPNNEGRKISCEDIQLVQNLIERCLQLYMNQNEVITTLQYQAKIEPGFTSLGEFLQVLFSFSGFLPLHPLSSPSFSHMHVNMYMCMYVFMCEILKFFFFFLGGSELCFCCCSGFNS
jgi:hypothetical protein